MKLIKKTVPIGIALCAIMVSVLVSPALAYTQYCYGWQHANSNVTGVMSSVKLNSAVHHQPGESMRMWSAIAVISLSGGNMYNVAEINLVYYEADGVAQLFFTAQAMKQGVWQSPVASYISISYLSSNNLRMACGRNGNTWQYYYSLDSGSTWNTLRQFDFGYQWVGDRYVTTFENEGPMFAFIPPVLAGQTTGITYQYNGGTWYNANLDTVLNSGADPQVSYTHGTNYEVATFID